jgi:hypothetical protein
VYLFRSCIHTPFSSARILLGRTERSASLKVPLIITIRTRKSYAQLLLRFHTLQISSATWAGLTQRRPNRGPHNFWHAVGPLAIRRKMMIAAFRLTDSQSSSDSPAIDRWFPVQHPWLIRNRWIRRNLAVFLEQFGLKFSEWNDSHRCFSPGRAPSAGNLRRYRLLLPALASSPLAGR